MPGYFQYYQYINSLILYALNAYDLQQRYKLIVKSCVCYNRGFNKVR